MKRRNTRIIRKIMQWATLIVIMLIMMLWCVSGNTARAASHKPTRKAEKVLRVAKSWKGVPYRYGGCSRKGVDCSCYTRLVFRKVGVHLPRTAAAQWRAERKHKVSRSHRRAGDLVFYFKHGKVYHAAIYAGNGKVWHAPHRGERVKRARIHGNVGYARPKPLR